MMWKLRSDILATSTEITKQATWSWNEEYQKDFEHMIKSIFKEILLLVYPNFSKPFEINTDARAGHNVVY